MAAQVIHLLVDGESVEVRFAMASMVAVERKFGGAAWEQHPMEAGAYAAWFTLAMPGGPDGFDDWLVKVEMDDQKNPQSAATE